MIRECIVYEDGAPEKMPGDALLLAVQRDMNPDTVPSAYRICMERVSAIQIAAEGQRFKSRSPLLGEAIREMLFAP